MRLRKPFPYALHQAEYPARNLFQLPPFLHRQTEIPGYRGSRGTLPKALRQDWRRNRQGEKGYGLGQRAENTHPKKKNEVLVFLPVKEKPPPRRAPPGAPRRWVQGSRETLSYESS